MSDKVLVLMVGTNPLPNYVVGSYLKKNYDKFVLIYSDKNENINQSSTADYANKLKKHLNLNNNNCTVPLSNVSNPSAIRDDLKEKFPEDNIDEVHLNYTGGTKTMAVHVYNFLKEKFNNKFNDNKFNASYLDARSHKLIYDNGERSGSLKGEIKIDIDTLLSIHLYKKNKLETNDTYTYKQKFGDNFDSISEKIKNAIKDGKGKDFVKWLKDPFRKIFKGDEDLLKKPDKFEEHIQKLNGSNQSLIDEFNKLLEQTKKFEEHVQKLNGSNQSLIDEFNKLLEQTKKFEEHVQKLNGSNQSPIDRFNESPQFIWDILNAFPEDKRIVKNNRFPDRIEDVENIRYTVKFLDGIWLEWYVYNEIRNELLNKGLLNKGLEEGKHFGISLEAKKENSSKSPNFELDIFIINGYQLVGISITTSDKQGDCKLKGFEVIHRVRQIGGDESKAILITGMEPSRKDALQEDLSFMTGTANDKIVVFGIDDWADIGDKIYKEVFR